MDSEKDAREELPRLSAEDCERMREHALAGMRPPMTIRFWVVNLVEECRRLRAERDARPEIAAEDAFATRSRGSSDFASFVDANERITRALVAHARKAQP